MPVAFMKPRSGSRLRFVGALVSSFLFFLLLVVSPMQQQGLRVQEERVLEEQVLEDHVVEEQEETNGDKGCSKSKFDAAVALTYDLATTTSHGKERKPFDLETWSQRTAGGLTDRDRSLLAEIYGKAESVFEYGLGESTYIANHVGVPRYAGIDSDAAWVAMAREKVDSRFRFYFADIGETAAWGYPKTTLTKSIHDYQVQPLQTELLSFDVYMVDGRWRLPCLLLSFLHASARGAKPEDTIVLLHDCIKKEHTVSEGMMGDRRIRPEYARADHLLLLEAHSGNKLCVYKRRQETTDAQLFELWEQQYTEVKRR
jgi:hypothetical protein